MDAWLPLLFNSIEDLLPPVPPTSFKNASDLPPPRITLSALENGHNSSYTSGKLENYHLATVKCNNRITSIEWEQDVRHIEFDFKKDISYSPGDVAVIHPIVAEKNVEAFLDLMGWKDQANETMLFHVNEDGEQLVSFSMDLCLSFVLQVLPVPTRISRKTSLKQLFSSHLDFNAVPRRSFFSIIRHFAQEEHEAERLAEFCGPEGAVRLHSSYQASTDAEYIL